MSTCCPNCFALIALPSLEAIGRRGRCPKCEGRIVLSNTVLEVDALATKYPCRIGTITNGFRRFSIRIVKTSTIVTAKLFGSSTDVSSKVYLHGWIVFAPDHEMEVWVLGEFLGSLSSGDRQSLKKHEPFASEHCVIRCTVRLELMPNSKVESRFDLTCLEIPNVDPPKALPLSAIDGELRDVRGKLAPQECLVMTELSQLSRIAKKVTIRDCLEYLQMDDRTAAAYQYEKRRDPFSQKFFFLPSEALTVAPLVWFSDNRDYRATFESKNGQIVVMDVRPISKFFFSDQITRDHREKIPLEFSWFDGVGESRLRTKVLENADSKNVEACKQLQHPYIYRDWGRSATLSLVRSKDGKSMVHSPADEKKSDTFHFWAEVVGINYDDSSGVPRNKIAMSLQRGECVLLNPEPDNEYDPNAIEIVTMDRGKFGYLSSTLAIFLSSFLKSDYRLAAVVHSREPSHLTWETCRSGVGMQIAEVTILIAVARNSRTEIDLTEYLQKTLSTPFEPPH